MGSHRSRRAAHLTCVNRRVEARYTRKYFAIQIGIFERALSCRIRSTLSLAENSDDESCPAL